jgi:hypothetical protein
MNVVRIFSMILLISAVKMIDAQDMGLALEGTEWKGIHAYPVKGKNTFFKKQKLTFGDFHSIEVDRSWTKGTGSTSGLTVGVPTDDFYKKIITTDHTHKKQTLYFAMGDDAGHQSKAFCLSELDSKDFNIGNSDVSVFNLLLDIAGPGAKSSSIFYTKIFVGSSGKGWELMLDNEAAQAQPKKYIGYLAKNANEYYAIAPASKVKSKKGKVGTMPFGSAGFTIRDQDGKAVAAVSIIDNGIIYLMDVEPEQRLLLATTCAVLLLRPAEL